jgi:ATP-dependent DNA helicase PIF1
MTEGKLNHKQNIAYNAMSNLKNVFLTGLAGTGKTHLIKLFKENYENSRTIGTTSTTGISALLFGGTTLHSYLGIGLGKSDINGLEGAIESKPWIHKRWRDLDALIIDEISMLDPDLFDKLEELARRLRRSRKPFGGIQLIISGDFLQLPCVGSEKFCFQAKTWESCIDVSVYLTENMRQSDPELQGALADIRMCVDGTKLKKSTKKFLKSRHHAKIKNIDGIRPTELYPTNASVDDINNQELDELAEKGCEFNEYNMHITLHKGIKKYVLEKFNKNTNMDSQLQLAVDTQVMLLINLDIEAGLVNGSRGVVIRFENEIPVVKFMNGIEKVIDYHIGEVEENDPSEGCVCSYNS